MPVRLVATDLDGTFFASDHRPTARTVAAWNAVRASGIPVVAITGRSHFNGLGLVTSAGAELDWFIGSNGGHRINVPTGVMEERLAFTDEETHLICRDLADRFDGLGFGWETIAEVWWDNRFLELYPQTLGGKPRVGRTATLFPNKLPLDVSKVFIAHPELAGTDLVDLLEPALPLDAHVSSSGVWVSEITPVGADKGSALARLCAELAIEASDVVVFGDNQNDLSMMKWAGRSIAMGNALPMVKAVATEITTTNDDHGVARLLETMV